MTTRIRHETPDHPTSLLHLSRLFHVAAFTTLCLISSNASSLQTAGWIEQAQVVDADLDFKAKLDTGADNTSINALDIEIFVIDGKEHVRFKVKNKQGKTVELVKPVVRYAQIKRHLTPPQKRPVVHLVICIGNVQKETRVSLVDREKFKYPLLIGRSYMAGEFLIDSASKFRLKNSCINKTDQ